MKIKVEPISELDCKKICDSGLDAHACLDSRIKLVCLDEAGHKAISYMARSDFDRLGLLYIEEHAVLEYSKVCDEWFMKCSQNAWYNDQGRHPDKVIDVRFVEIESGTGREVYRGTETGRYYLRDVSPREPFAKWYVCGTRRVCDDGNEPRPNLIFRCGEQFEKVVYDDWNGVAAYGEQFNKNFCGGG